MRAALVRLCERILAWDERRTLSRITEDEYLGCCSCGRQGAATRQYYSQLLGDPARGTVPDWWACDTCHNEDTPHGEGLRAARSEPIPPLAEARKKVGL